MPANSANTRCQLLIHGVTSRGNSYSLRRTDLSSYRMAVLYYLFNDFHLLHSQFTRLSDLIHCLYAATQNMTMYLTMRFYTYLVFTVTVLADDREVMNHGHDPVNDFCRRWGHSTAEIGSRLYIDGGYINYSPLSQEPKNYTSQERSLFGLWPLS
jgi:hypothetical protein